MVEQYIIQAETLMRMANALRNITGNSTGTFTPAEMADVVSHLYVEPACSDEIIATVNSSGYIVIDHNNAPDVDLSTVNGLIGIWVQGSANQEVPIYAMAADDNAVAVQIGGSGPSYTTFMSNDPSALSITKNSVRYLIDPNCLIADSTDIHTFRVRLVYSDTLADRPEIELQDKIVVPSFNEQVVAPDSGYDGLSSVTVEAVPTTEQATPQIDISTSGLITASAAQTEGYVSSGTKSATMQLATQSAKTVTPGTTNQVAVASNVYATGEVTVSGDANLKAENIAEGVKIFGVEGTHIGGIKLPTLTNEGSAADLLNGKELIDGDGNVVTGSILTKSSDDLLTNGPTVTVPSGYYSTQASKSVSTAEQAVPSISVSNAGLITASATQAEGYVSAGTKTATQQLSTQAAKTVTPTKSSQTAVSAGVYTTGAVSVGAIPDEYITTTDATAASGDILSGKTAYVNGSKVTGSIATKTASNLTASGATVTVPAGYYATDATKSVSTATRAETTISTTADDTSDKLTITASNNQGTGYVTGANKTATTTISLTASGATVTASDGSKSISKSVATATQATPSVSVDANGLITASATQTAGYVSAGTKSGTKQLTVQAAKTVTPTKSSQTAVAKNVYTTGAVTVDAIPAEYITTTDATVSADEIFAGETAYANGSKVTGTFTIDNELSTQDNLITQIQTALQNKASGVALPALSNPASASDMLSGKEAINGIGQKITGTIATKTSSNLTASGATVTVPAGYYASQATKSVSTATQATPSVSVSSSGLITASATQTAGYVAAGTKSGTKQLTTQAAKTVTPSTSSQTAVASGVYTTGAVTVAAIPSTYVKPSATKAATTYTPTTSNQTIAAGTYCSGAQTIKGDANLKAENIAEGVSIFGITGTHSGGGGSGGGSSTAGEWVSLSSLPIGATPRIAEPDSKTYYYYEVPNNCNGVIFRYRVPNSFDAYYITYKNSANYFVTTTCGNYGTMTDTDNTGSTITLAMTAVAESCAVLPIYKIG